MYNIISIVQYKNYILKYNERLLTKLKSLTIKFLFKKKWTKKISDKRSKDFFRKAEQGVCTQKQEKMLVIRLDKVLLVFFDEFQAE